MKYLRAYAVREDGEPTDDGPVTFVASTEGVKGDGLDLQADAWDLTRYEKYSPILWAHDYWGERPPIGTGAASIQDSKLMIDVTFDADDPFAMTIRGKALKGMVAGSVGWDDVTKEEETSHQLLEFSMVPVPMDPDALPVRQARGQADLIGLWNESQELFSKAVSLPHSFVSGDDLKRWIALGKNGGMPLVNNASTFDEADWPEVAGRMVRLFARSADDSDEERKHTYNRLERRYRQLGKVAPEFRTNADIEPLGPAEIRGLFLEGEPELHADLFPEPLRLRVRQLAEIKDHLAAINDLLEQTEVEPEPEPDGDAATLQQLSDTLASLKIGA